jgi:hypothetical protein
LGDLLAQIVGGEAVALGGGEGAKGALLIFELAQLGGSLVIAGIQVGNQGLELFQVSVVPCQGVA